VLAPSSGCSGLREHYLILHLIGTLRLVEELLGFGLHDEVRLVIIVAGVADLEDALLGLGKQKTDASCSSAQRP
jgi:hypothetical protein